jgi:Uma2 family endonuclease
MSVITPAGGASPDLGPQYYTAEDLERLSTAGYRYELVRGELKAMSPAGGRHGSRTKRLDHWLSSHVYQHDLGECFTAETGFLIEQDPDTVLAPDWAYLGWDKVPDPMPDGWVRVVPDLVLETRSPGDTRKEMDDKIQQWIQAGVCVALDYDPKSCRIVVHRPGATPEVLGETDTLVLEDVLPGFSLPLRRLLPRRRST